MEERWTKEEECFMRKLFKKYIAPICPLYALIPLISCFIFDSLVYCGIQALTKDWGHYDFTGSIDRKVPFIKEFVIIYLICYAFWAVNYILISRQGKEHCFRLVAADMISHVICGIFFLLLPTTNIRPEIMGNGICDNLVRWLYGIDASSNLFPSIHCLVSWLCYVGIRSRKNIPKWYRIFSCIFAILICISTQVIKQHYIIDLIAGVGLAEGAWRLSWRFKWYRGFERVFDRISWFVFGRENV